MNTLHEPAKRKNLKLLSCRVLPFPFYFSLHVMMNLCTTKSLKQYFPRRSLKEFKHASAFFIIFSLFNSSETVSIVTS